MFVDGSVSGLSLSPERRAENEAVVNILLKEGKIKEGQRAETLTDLNVAFERVQIASKEIYTWHSQNTRALKCEFWREHVDPIVNSAVNRGGDSITLYPGIYQEVKGVYELLTSVDDERVLKTAMHLSNWYRGVSKMINDLDYVAVAPGCMKEGMKVYVEGVSRLETVEQKNPGDINKAGGCGNFVPLGAPMKVEEGGGCSWDMAPDRPYEPAGSEGGGGCSCRDPDAPLENVLNIGRTIVTSAGYYLETLDETEDVEEETLLNVSLVECGGCGSCDPGYMP